MEVVRTEYVLAPMTDAQAWVEFAAAVGTRVIRMMEVECVTYKEVAFDCGQFSDAMLAEYKKRFDK